MRKMKQVLVTGGTGVAGRTLIQKLLNRGCSVTVLSRSGVLPGQFGGRVTSVCGDIRDKSAVLKALCNVDTVFHLAARVGSSSSGLDDDWYASVNTFGTRVLVEASKAEGVERIVFFSSISVYGKAEPGVIHDETSMVNPDSGYARSKVSAEKLILSATNQNGHPLGVVLRVASVYGPREKKNYSRLIQMVSHGLFVSFGNEVRRTLIHDYDLAEAAMLAAEYPGAVGAVFNVTDGCIHTMGAIAHAIESALNRRSVHLGLPICFSEVLRKIIFKQPLCFLFRSVIRNLMEKMIMDTAVFGGAIHSQLGFKPDMDLKKGWQDAVSRYQQKG